MERIQLFNTETERSAYFVFDLEELIIYSQGQETGEATESINIKFSGNISKIVFPTRNLIDILNHFDSEVVKFEMTDQNGPCKITGQEDPNYLVMIMPVKVDEETFYTDEEVEEDETL